MISLSLLTFMRLVSLYPDTHVRLTGLNSTYAGRVEVFTHGVWGRVLHYQWVSRWSNKEATVVCRQLGFPGAITAFLYEPSGDNSKPGVMSAVQCTGSENTIQQCQHRDWTTSKVYAYESDVGVVCKTQDCNSSDLIIRLQGSSVPYAGRVEVLYAGIWGAIGGNNVWNINAATVVCRQLGYQTGAHAALTTRVYGLVSGPVWVTNLQCSGSEANVTDCSHDVIGNKSESFSRWAIASVICKNGSLPSGMPVRLGGSPSPNMGRVEVYYAGKWGSIQYGDMKGASVVCRELGYSGAFLSGYEKVFCSFAVPRWFRRFNCYGNESSLDQCSRTFYEFNSDYGYYDGNCWSVVCKDKRTATGLQVRLRGSPVPHAGRVELRYKGFWGTIGCDNDPNKRYIDPGLARVICRQLNFTDGILATGWSVYGKGTGPQWFYNDELRCPENASNILNCSQREPRLARRYYHSDLSVVCKPDVSHRSGFQIRLTGSSLPHVGTIEVMYHGVWGSVLGDGIDINVGHVVCRQLGYPGADLYSKKATFGQVRGPMWIWEIQCSGNEKEISQCMVTTWQNITSSLYESYLKLPLYAAGVLCRKANSSASKELNVRITGAPISNAGRVEVFYAGVWGTIYGYVDGHVICRQLGYPRASASGFSDRFGVGTGPLWFRFVMCFGNEPNFGDCPKILHGAPNGFQDIIATVICDKPDCSKVKCANNGTCITTAAGSFCNCTDGFTGQHCNASLFNPCQSSPCENGGKCFRDVSSYICVCPKGFTGQHCEERIVTAIVPCQSQPCPNNTSCYQNETDYVCLSNNQEANNNSNNENRTPRGDNDKSTSGAETTTFNIYFIVTLSVSVTLVVALAVAIVYLAAKSLKLTNHQPNNPAVVFSNTATNGNAVNNIDEEASHSSVIDPGTAATDTLEQTSQDPGPVYEEARRPLPPIPVEHDTTRRNVVTEFDIHPNPTALRSNITFSNEAPATQASTELMRLPPNNRLNATQGFLPGTELMRLPPNNIHNAAQGVLPGTSGTYYNSCTLLEPDNTGDTSFSSIHPPRAQTSVTKQQGNNGERANINESYVLYQNQNT